MDASLPEAPARVEAFARRRLPLPQQLLRLVLRVPVVPEAAEGVPAQGVLQAARERLQVRALFRGPFQPAFARGWRLGDGGRAWVQRRVSMG